MKTDGKTLRKSNVNRTRNCFAVAEKSLYLCSSGHEMHGTHIEIYNDTDKYSRNRHEVICPDIVSQNMLPSVLNMQQIDQFVLAKKPKCLDSYNIRPHTKNQIMYKSRTCKMLVNNFKYKFPENTKIYDRVIGFIPNNTKVSYYPKGNKIRREKIDEEQFLKSSLLDRWSLSENPNYTKVVITKYKSDKHKGKYLDTRWKYAWGYGFKSTRKSKKNPKKAMKRDLLKQSVEYDDF